MFVGKRKEWDVLNKNRGLFSDKIKERYMLKEKEGNGCFAKNFLRKRMFCKIRNI